MEQDVDENTQKYQADMKIQNKELKRVQIYCEELLRKIELQSERKSTELIAKFTSFRKHQYRDLDLQPDKSLQLDDFETELLKAVAVLEDDLMEIEMLLQEALSRSYSDFQDKTKALSSTMYQKTVEYFKLL